MREYDNWHQKFTEIRKIKIAISVAISSCFVGNLTTAIKKETGRLWRRLPRFGNVICASVR